jgi:hypothetical protein
MSIQVGIQSGVKFAEVSKDDNNNVVLMLTQGEEVDAMEALMSGASLSGPESSKVLVWALKGMGYGDAPIVGKKAIEHINEYKAFFNEILLQFYPSTELKWETLFSGLNIKSVDNLSASEIETVGRNVVNYFVEKMQAADKTKAFRVKFYRVSESKNFVTLVPKMFMKFGKEQPNGLRSSWTVPFIESMDIPEAASKLKYSDFERGLDKDGNKVTWDKSSNASVSADAPAPQATNDDPFAV